MAPVQHPGRLVVDRPTEEALLALLPLGQLLARFRLDAGVARREKDRLLPVFPAHAVVVSGLTAEHLGDGSGLTRDADAVARDHQPVAD